MKTREITARFRKALNYAAEKHAQQYRKAGDIPYLAHLLAVCSTVMENTTNEDVWIAALLHDAVEDQGGQATADEIETQFGKRVVAIVLGCSDSIAGIDSPKEPWLKRKLAYFENLAHVDEGIILVSIADKIHNARSILRDMRACGDDVYCRFTAGKPGTQWYYQRLLHHYQQSGLAPGNLLEEYEAIVKEFAPDPVDLELVRATLNRQS
jgi:(p)ppGpp synthase/HD superfamily hydrolase